jgi:hypothetical protein
MVKSRFFSYSRTSFSQEHSMTTIKSIQTDKYVIILEETEDYRYIVRFKRQTMKEYAYYSFPDYKFADRVFDNTLIELEGN